MVNLIPEGFYHLCGTDWDTEKPRFIEKTLDYFSRFAVPGLVDHVQVVECATPLDFERHLLLPEGAIYCLQEDLAAQAVFRPSAKSKNISGLYLTGSSTHPGGTVKRRPREAGEAWPWPWLADRHGQPSDILGYRR